MVGAYSKERHTPMTNHPQKPGQPLSVLLLENIHQTAVDVLHRDGLQPETLAKSLPPAQLRERLRGVQVLGIRSKTHLSAELLSCAPDLLAVGCFCIGTNQVDLHAANVRGIPVFNAPFSNTRSVAEMILGEIIALARQLGDRSREVHAKAWRKVSAGCHEVRGKTLGIVGYGHIGSQVGVLAESLGMRVLFYDIASKLALGNCRACDSLEELLGQSDYVTLHVPATPQTHLLIGEAQLQRMRKGSYLLNASRGTVVDIAALCAALRTRHLAGAAIDVYPEEPEENTDGFITELAGLPNVILTPHIGGSTEEAQANIGREVAASLVKFLSQGATTGAVNFPQAELAVPRKTHRVLNVHRNVPGVLRDINRVVSDLNANIHGQLLSTDNDIGYLIMDLDQDVSEQVCERLADLATSIRTRVV
jgi:D-3-phosphoglycerate dehydrogenase / 2-oxoglutarate reductase